MKEHKEIIEFRYDTQLLLDKYGADDDECDDLVDEIRDHIISTFQGDSLIVAGDTGEDDFGGEKATIKLHYHTNRRGGYAETDRRPARLISREGTAVSGGKESAAHFLWEKVIYDREDRTGSGTG